MGYTKFMKTILGLILMVIVSRETFAQQSVVRLPRDAANNPLIAGLGLPFLINPTITVTSYDTSNRTALSTTGADTNRQYRHVWVYNPSASVGIFLCVGNSTGCSTDMWYAPPSLGFVDDFAFFGAANNITHIYYRLSGAGTVAPVIRWW